MTDYDALRQYVRACEYLRSLKEQGPTYVPVHEPPTKEDQKAIDHVRKHWQKEVGFCFAVIDQAERAVEDLPKNDWRGLMQSVYLNGEEVWEASQSNYISERTSARYIRQSLDYLEQREKNRESIEETNGNAKGGH